MDDGTRPRAEEAIMPERTPGEPEDNNELAAELARLRTRVQELEEEVSRKPPTRGERDRGDDRESSDVRDVPERTVDEMSKLVRGLVLAAVEPIRMAGQLASHFGDEVRSRNRPKRAETRSGGRSEQASPTRLVSDLPRDISAGLNRVLDESLDIPGRVVDRFHEAYKESESVQRTRAERELARAQESLTRAERVAKTRREAGSEATRNRQPEAESPIIIE